MSKKAQIGTLDLFLAICAGSVLLIGILYTLHHYNSILNNKMLYNDLQMTSFAAIDYLTRNPGVPADWENNITAAERIGFAYRPYIISEDKITAFNDAMNYSSKKKMLNSPFEFYFAIKSLNNTMIAESGKYPAARSFVINTQRRVIYGGNAAIAELIMWDKK